MHSSLYTQLKRAGQGMLLVLALFLFGNNALAYTENFITTLGDTSISVKSLGGITFTGEPEFLSVTGFSSLHGGAKLYVFARNGAVSDNNNEHGACDGFNCQSDFIPDRTILQTAYPDGIDIYLGDDWSNNSIPDAFKSLYKHIDWTPSTPTCPAGATGALCQIGGAVATQSFDVLDWLIQNIFPFVIMFIFFGGAVYLLTRTSKVAKFLRGQK